MAPSLLALSRAEAQKYTPPPPPLTTAPCVPTRKDPCAQPDVTPATPATAQKFPFPGDAPAPSAAEKFPFPGESTAPPATPGAGTTPQDAARDHPFPGDPAATPAGSSSSSSSGYAADDGADAADETPAKPVAANRFTRKHLAKVEDKDNREAQDVEVSRYYASTGDFRAAYLRAQDAVSTVPTDSEAHLVLADAARHLGKLDEARREYAQYVALEPEGDHVKAARKALADLGPGVTTPK